MQTMTTLRTAAERVADVQIGSRKQTAANNPVLARVKSHMNGKTYAECLALANADGLDAMLQYLGQFFNEDLRAERLSWFRDGDTPGETPLGIPDAEDIHAERILAAERRGFLGDLGNFQADVNHVIERAQSGRYREEARKGGYSVLVGDGGAVMAVLYQCLCRDGSWSCSVTDTERLTEFHPSVIEAAFDTIWGQGR